MEKKYNYKKTVIFKDPNSDLDFHWFDGSSTKHSHDYYEIVIVTCGTIQHHYLNKSTNLYEKDVVLICPNKTHEICAPKRTKHFNISISKELFTKLCNIVDLNLLTFIHKNMDIKIHLSDTQLNYFFFQINMLLSDPKKENVIISSILYQILSNIALSYLFDSHSADFTNTPEWFKNFIEQISMPSVFVLPLRQIYKLSGYSQAALIRYFKKYTNTTPQNYVTDIKINYAKNLLTKTNTSILDISLNLGFQSLSRFMTLFKQKTGLTPKEYRKKSYSNGLG